jgi:hypothetical protein
MRPLPEPQSAAIRENIRPGSRTSPVSVPRAPRRTRAGHLIAGDSVDDVAPRFKAAAESDDAQAAPAPHRREDLRRRQAETRKMTFLFLGTPSPSHHQRRYAPTRPAATATSWFVPASRTERPSLAQDVVPAVPSCRWAVVPSGGERFTARPVRGSDQSGSSHVIARLRRRRAGGAARRDDEDELNAHVKKVVDASAADRGTA